MDENLRIARGREAMTSSLELSPKLHVVVDLAALRDPDPAVLAAEGLRTMFRIADGKACVDHPEGVGQIEAGLIGSPVTELTCH